ncbi:uncharacterized protein LOC142550711 [Primulina tabacum]|uniref:uncharacterized protein LOC142550711 n=1 Tax=Primulina tabacum TaxID=48773 RepID=UPI003F5A7495
MSDYIMSATIGNNPSFIWRSMIWSRNLLTKGIRWRVGNGKKIQTFSDIWIPGVRDPLHDLSDQEHFKSVNKLIQQGSWNETVIRQIFPSYIAEEVLNIPLAGELTEDVRYWRQDPKGCYSVRDGYKTEIGCYEPPPNCSEIHSRISGHCRLCNYGRDTTEHALFWCPRTKACWNGTIFKTLLKKALRSDIVDIFLWMKEQFNRQDFECFAVHTWAVWFERQKLLHNEDRNLTSISTDWSTHMLNEYREARTAINCCPITQPLWYPEKMEKSGDESTKTGNRCSV